MNQWQKNTLEMLIVNLTRSSDHIPHMMDFIVEKYHLSVNSEMVKAIAAMLDSISSVLDETVFVLDDVIAHEDGNEAVKWFSDDWLETDENTSAFPEDHEADEEEGDNE